jgi:hypothetical protein
MTTGQGAAVAEAVRVHAAVRTGQAKVRRRPGLSAHTNLHDMRVIFIGILAG